MSRQIDQEIIQATDELKNDVALTTDIVTGNENTVVEVAPGNTVRSPKKMIEDCYQETQKAIEQKFGSLDQAVNDATAAAGRADSASQSASDSAGDSADSATTASQKAQEANASSTKAASSEQAAGNSATQSATSAANAKASETAAGQSAVNAADSATAAATSATTATTKSEQAGQSAATATQQATRAQAWAANPVDDLVEGELYSSLHYARQSSDSAANSSASADQAEASATQAKTSETASASSASQAQGSATSANSSASDALNSANKAKASETAGQQSASTAQTAEQNAQESASQAGVSATAAAGSASTATQQADRSESEANRSEAAAASLKAISNPNLLINGDFSVWQRGTSFSGLAKQYTADRWSGYKLNVSRVGGQGIANNTVSVVLPEASGATAWACFAQIIEDCGYLRGKTVTLSFDIKWVTRDPTARPGWLRWQNANGVYTGAEVYFGEMPTEVNKWVRISHSVVVPDVAEGVHLDLRIHANSVASPTIKAHFDIANVKLELGSVATPFIPDDPAINLAKCQRYYYRLSGPVAASCIVGNPFNIRYLELVFPTTMRTVPTMSGKALTGKIERSTAKKDVYRVRIVGVPNDTHTEFVDGAFDAEL